MAGNNGFRPSKQHLQTCSSFVLASILASTLQIYFFSPISPDPLHLPPVSAAINLPTNNKLQVVQCGGSLYFGLHHWYLDLLEAKPLLNETSTILDNLVFPNGVALSQDEDFLVVCETWKCLKYWLKGERKGRTETFIDNLPNGPDNINLAPDGSFWIALIKLASDGFESVHASKALKHFVATFPKLFQLVNGSNEKATVVTVAADGKIVDKFDDPNGKVMSFVISALEFEDHLYLGSLNTNFIGKLPLKAA
ncbi:Adipocyte plasma membrane-associated protein [Vitis vinifera]|uniref:Adipocyte plasma membrane-associated protein n=1 Tax=Vitis vinifera TaxID=29760 RepID=A0A438E8E1_VITVI|nr:Adipocyte plasma membrane-associated protein [Vitis vinifera]